MANWGVLDAWRWGPHAPRGIFLKKRYAFPEIDILSCFVTVFYEGSTAVWRGFGEAAGDHLANMQDMIKDLEEKYQYL